MAADARPPDLAADESHVDRRVAVRLDQSQDGGGGPMAQHRILAAREERGRLPAEWHVAGVADGEDAHVAGVQPPALHAMGDRPPAKAGGEQLLGRHPPALGRGDGGHARIGMRECTHFFRGGGRVR
jgi:hypothetical protein